MHKHVCTFNICCDGVEAGDLVCLSRVAPKDVVFRVNTNGRVGQILLSFSFKSTRKSIQVCCMHDCRYKYWVGCCDYAITYLFALSSFLSITMRFCFSPSMAGGTRPKITIKKQPHVVIKIRLKKRDFQCLSLVKQLLHCDLTDHLRVAEHFAAADPRL